MSDQIILRSMEFDVRIGAGEEERSMPQAIEIDVELSLDLAPAGKSDELSQTVNYSQVFKLCRRHAESRAYNLLEALAEIIATDVLAQFEKVDSIFVEVRKPGVPIDGVLEHSAVRVERWREMPAPRRTRS